MEQNYNYDIVKASILRCYLLVPEAYRQCFRLRKTNVKLVLSLHVTKKLFSTVGVLPRKVDSQAKLQELILLEEFKNCLPSTVATYLNEQVNTLPP